ncbi:MAG: thioredoxin family protein [Myxococcota bacterium]
MNTESPPLPRRGLALAAALSLLCAASCAAKDDATPAAQGDQPPTAASAQPAAAAAPTSKTPTAAAAQATCAGPATRGPLAWFSDDYSAALACARATGRPLVIDLWAPWCHTCLSMKKTVLVDRSLAPLAERFVWLELDTDKESNAPALAKFPPQVWPTFFVVAPADESVQARFLGAASVVQFRDFVSDGEKAALAAEKLPADSPLALVRAGDRAMAEGAYSAAQSAYSRAVATLPADSTRRPDVLVALISAHYKGDDAAGCMAVARGHMDQTGTAASAADFLLYAHRCAAELSEKGDQGDAAGAAASGGQDIAALRRTAVRRLETLIADGDAPLSVDDRGEAMRIAREYLIALGDRDGARAMAERQRTLLDRAAADAPNPFAAMTYNWPRAEVYAYLDAAAELIPALQKSVDDLPNEYDPPYRLSWVYAQIGQHDKAAALIDTALARAYGPRKAHMQRLAAEIHKARGDVAGERAARQAVVDLYEALPAGQQQPAALAKARSALAAVAGQGSPATK